MKRESWVKRGDLKMRRNRELAAEGPKDFEEFEPFPRLAILKLYFSSELN